MPSNHLVKLANSLFEQALDRERFIAALEDPAPLPSAIVWLLDRPSDFTFERYSKREAWIPEFVDLTEQKLGSTSQHEQGYFYILDPSSVFAVSSLATLALQSPRVLDVCSAPGGKAIFAKRALNPSHLVCNEVIKKRHRALGSNLVRCKAIAEIKALDPKILGEQFGESFDLVLVDAPCSGQSLLAKGEKALGCFHPSTINLNSNRQKKIIANASRCVTQSGYLLYTTCTFSIEENEKVIEWFLKRFPEFDAVEQEQLSEFRSIYTKAPCYRLYPFNQVGAGAFSCLLRKKS